MQNARHAVMELFANYISTNAGLERWAAINNLTADEAEELLKIARRIFIANTPQAPNPTAFN